MQPKGQVVSILKDILADKLPELNQTIIPANTEATLIEKHSTYAIIEIESVRYKISADTFDFVVPKEYLSQNPRFSPSSLDQTYDLASSTTRYPSKEEIERNVWEELKKCYDPEIPVNIVDLGLVYDCKVEALSDSKYKVTVKMTLTAPGCILAPYIQAQVYNRLISIPYVEEAEVLLVWDPPWNPNMISEEIRLQLGLL